ncbi:hypothetical protein AMTRI_Chr03g43810 [Amborella trichopoda]
MKTFIVINSFISSISKQEKKGSVEFQVFCFTDKIRKLTSHLELHKKDFLSQRGMRKILENKNKVRYKKLIGQLNIREPKTR